MILVVRKKMIKYLIDLMSIFSIGLFTMRYSQPVTFCAASHRFNVCSNAVPFPQTSDRGRPFLQRK